MDKQKRRIYYIEMQLRNIQTSYNQDLDKEEYLKYGEEDFNCFLEMFKDKK